MEELYIYFFIPYGSAILFPLLYHLSKHKNNLICALIPMIPFMGLLGLILINKFDGGINEYLSNIIIFTLLYVLLFTTIYICFLNNNNLSFSIIIGLSLWFLLVYNYLYYKRYVLQK